jgi:hypothetical protein
MHYLAVRNKEELQNKIVPFFSLYPLNSGKHQDFLHFKSAVSILYANKGKGLKSLTEEQRNHLNFCISNMNKNRYAIP